MNPPALLGAIGFGVAAGLNGSLTLLIAAILVAGGNLRLAAPFDGLGSPAAVILLVAVAVIEFIADKTPGAGRLARPLLLAWAIASGMVLYAAEVISGGHPPNGLPLLATLLPGAAIAGSVHAARALLRPPMSAAGLGLQASWVEDLAATGLAIVAGAAPFLVPVALGLLAALVYDSARRLTGAGQALLWFLEHRVLDRWLESGGLAGLGPADEDGAPPPAPD